MSLSEILLENERNNQIEKSNQLVRIRLKELVSAYPNEMLQVLHNTGVAVSALLPSPVIYSVVVKNLQTNSELREAVAKMLLELDGYSSADGAPSSAQKWQVIGGSLSALGSILSGIGRSQTEQSQTVNSAELDQAKQQAEQEKNKRVRTTWLIVGISVVVIVGVIISFKMYSKSTVKPKIQIA